MPFLENLKKGRDYFRNFPFFQWKIGCFGLYDECYFSYQGDVLAQISIWVVTLLVGDGPP